MMSKMIFVVSHLILGAAVFWSVIIQESGVITISNAVSIISFVLVSLLNYWIWMCPMDRIRNVRSSEITKEIRVASLYLFKILVLS